MTLKCPEANIRQFAAVVILRGIADMIDEAAPWYDRVAAHTWLGSGGMMWGEAAELERACEAWLPPGVVSAEYIVENGADAEWLGRRLLEEMWQISKEELEEQLQNLSASEVARKHAVSLNAVLAAIKRYDIEYTRVRGRRVMLKALVGDELGEARSGDETWVKHLRSLMETGVSQSRMAGCLGVTQACVNGWVRKLREEAGE